MVLLLHKTSLFAGQSRPRPIRVPGPSERDLSGGQLIAAVSSDKLRDRNTVQCSTVLYSTVRSGDRNTQEVTEREELPGHGYRGGRGTETGAAMHTLQSTLFL